MSNSSMSFVMSFFLSGLNCFTGFFAITKLLCLLPSSIEAFSNVHKFIYSLDLDKDDLVEMFANLISNSFDSRAYGLHPAFASIISQLNTQDARLLKLLAKSYIALPIISVDVISTNSISPIPGYYSDCDRLREYKVETNAYSLESVIDNLERLKLAKLNSKVICFEDEYKRVRENPAFQQMFMNVKNSMRENKFRLELTSFGRMFTMACIS